MTTNKRKAAIFDVDGVLIDSHRAHKQSWFETAAKYNWYIDDDKFVQSFGMQNYSIIELLSGQKPTPELVKKAGDWKEERFRELIAESVPAMKGVSKLLDDLKANHWLLAVGSSAPKANVDLTLKATGMLDKFDAIVTGEEIENGKPAPDTFLRAAEKLNTDPQNCIVIEDAVAGVKGGKNAAMAVIALTSTRTRKDLHEADLIIDNFLEITSQNFEKLIQDTAHSQPKR